MSKINIPLRKNSDISLNKSNFKTTDRENTLESDFRKSDSKIKNKKKKLGNFSKYGNFKNENIKDKNDRYDDDNTPSKNSEFQINNSPLNKINIDNLNLSEKNIVVQSIKILLNAIDKESLQDIRNEIDKILLKK